MFSSKIPRRILLSLSVLSAFTAFQASSAEPDPSVMAFKMPDKITWVKSPNGKGPDTAILFGDPSKPGAFYELLTRWPPHTMSRPHFHANDRFIYVVSGTWWVGWGTKYNPESTYAMPAGSFVQHYGKKIHYDGSKEGEVVLLMAGDGPDKATPAEEK